MVEMRWERDMEEAMELVYRIQTDHGGRLPESEAREKFGAWVADPAERAERQALLARCQGVASGPDGHVWGMQGTRRGDREQERRSPAALV